MSVSFMSGKSGIIIPLVLAVIGVVLITHYVKTKEGELELSAELVQVVVAKVDIPAYTKLDKTMVKTFAVPRKFLPSSAFHSLDDVDKRVTMVPILEGDHVLATMVSGRNQPVGLSLKIRKGYRAVSVGVDVVSGVAGLIRPGDKVDVLGTFPVQSGNSSKKQTFTVLRGLVVLAVGKNMGKDSMLEQAYQAESFQDMQERVEALRVQGKIDYESVETVTLLVEPMQAQKIFLTRELGELSLSLCPLVGDDGNEQIEPIDGKKMLGIKQKIYTPRPWGEIHGAQRR